MKGILNFKGIERTLISFRLPHRRRIDTSGYPCSLPRDSFFYVSFLAEEGDDFFLHWMCGKNLAHGGAKGFWHEGEIVFYDETSDGQEFYRYDLQYVMPIHFRLEYDHQSGMVIHLTLTALDRVYNHLLHTENFYGYFFEYAKPKEKPKPMPKEEPVVYVRDLEADKPEAQPNEKVTFSVIEYSIPREKVTENDKRRVQWAIKIDDKPEVLKEKGEKLELTIKEEWAGKEIIVMPYLVKPTEKVSEKVKVIKFPMLIVQGKKRVGKNEDGTLANDLYFGDYQSHWNKEDIKAKFIRDLRREKVSEEKIKDKADDIIAELYKYLEVSHKGLKQKLLNDKYLLVGNLAAPIYEYFCSEMRYYNESVVVPTPTFSEERYEIKEFESLKELVISAKETKEFVTQTQQIIKEEVDKEPILSKLKILENETGRIYDIFKQKNVRVISFNTRPIDLLMLPLKGKSEEIVKDIVKFSLSLAIHTIWTYKIYLLEYDKNAKKGKLRYELYDHFGLDAYDILVHNHSLFLKWFVLQRFYWVKPFITKISFEVDF